jgi:FdhD protein
MSDSLTPLRRIEITHHARLSFELVQKAWVAGIPGRRHGVGPSLAIELAREAGITLVGFLRGSSFNVYAHPHRIGV